MSLQGLLRRKSPTLIVGPNIVTFDAVLEDTLQIEVQLTQYPIELGARASDNALILPNRWTLRGSVSNNPLRIVAGDIAGGIVSNFLDSAILVQAIPVVAGYLSGDDETRAGSALAFLANLAAQREPFDIDAVDFQLQNLVITRLTRTRNPENENGLEFVAEMQELPILSTVITANAPVGRQLRDGDTARTQAVAEVNKGEISTLEPNQEALTALFEVSPETGPAP